MVPPSTMPPNRARAAHLHLPQHDTRKRGTLHPSGIFPVPANDPRSHRRHVPRTRLRLSFLGIPAAGGLQPHQGCLLGQLSQLQSTPSADTAVAIGRTPDDVVDPRCLLRCHRVRTRDHGIPVAGRDADVQLPFRPPTARAVSVRSLHDRMGRRAAIRDLLSHHVSRRSRLLVAQHGGLRVHLRRQRRGLPARGEACGVWGAGRPGFHRHPPFGARVCRTSATTRRPGHGGNVSGISDSAAADVSSDGGNGSEVLMGVRDGWLHGWAYSASQSLLSLNIG
mmetsp:Transcript_21634/g.60204  ORF Transcript_21634/g.60204 Transcript_21634/m.60204 type:complete len:280 (+) Transcript_21634:765-1604(+)